MNKKFKNLTLKRLENNTLILTFDNNLDNTNLSVYYDISPDFKNKKILLQTKSNNIEFKDPNEELRNFYLLEANGFENAIIAERCLPLEGPCNFRDLGGFETSFGKKVKWNKFYRSDSLSTLTNKDLKYLEALNLKKILDFRSEQEAEYEKDKSIKDVEYINISAIPIKDNLNGNFNGNLDMAYLLKNSSSFLSNNNDSINFLEDSYKDMVFENKAFKALLEILKEDDIRPFVYHCKSGKDRTGIGSALILLLLGVPMDKVKEDYLASNIYRKNYNDSTLEKYKAYLDTEDKITIFKIIMEVKEEYFNAAFNKIFSKYETIEDYFLHEFNLNKEDINSLREKYLY